MMCSKAAQQALAGVAEAVEGAGLDERLDRLLVEHLEVDPLAEVVEVGERPVGLALGEEQPDEARPDVAHRRQPEDDLADLRAVGADLDRPG